MALINSAFEKLDKDGDGLISMKDMDRVYDYLQASAQKRKLLSGRSSALSVLRARDDAAYHVVIRAVPFRRNCGTEHGSGGEYSTALRYGAENAGTSTVPYSVPYRSAVIAGRSTVRGGGGEYSTALRYGAEKCRYLNSYIPYRTGTFRTEEVSTETARGSVGVGWCIRMSLRRTGLTHPPYRYRSSYRTSSDIYHRNLELGLPQRRPGEGVRRVPQCV